MNLKANFKLTEGSYMSPQGFSVICANAITRDTNNARVDTKVYHLHLSGVPGAGKSRVASQIATLIDTLVNVQTEVALVKLMHLDEAGSMKNDKWITDGEIVRKAVKCVVEEAYVRTKHIIIVTEGVSDNMNEIWKLLDEFYHFDLSLCCIVEPSTNVFSATMKSRADEGANFAYVWKERANWTYSQAEKFIHEQTLRLFTKLSNDGFISNTRPGILIHNHVLVGSGRAWYNSSESSLMSGIYVPLNKDNEK